MTLFRIRTIPVIQKDTTARDIEGIPTRLAPASGN